MSQVLCADVFSSHGLSLSNRYCVAIVMSLTVESSVDHRFSSTQPYAVLDRKERSRELAQKRRSTYKTLMQDLADELPFSKDVVSQVDYNSRLRLALCFFRAKNLLRENLEDLKNGKSC